MHDLQTRAVPAAADPGGNSTETAGGTAENRRKEKLFSRIMWVLVTQALLTLFGLLASGCSSRDGKVTDMADNRPLMNAVVFHNGHAVAVDAQGHFALENIDPAQPILVKAPGYRQTSISAKGQFRRGVTLLAFAPKALYLSQAGVGAPALRDPALKLIDETELNALVVDIKSDRGLISFSWDVPLGHEIGAFSKVSLEDPDAFVRELHKKDVYLIGRIAVFKDDSLGRNKPEWAILDKRTKKPYVDKEKMAWADPFREEVWDYNIALAKAAAELGFDEVQFDFVRFPAEKGGVLAYAKENTEEARVAAVSGFFARARAELAPRNVYISATISGATLWRKGDGDIGQKFEAVAPHVDYLCPLVYPSALSATVPGRKGNAVAAPREAVLQVLQRGAERIGRQPEKIRPWLQNFKDYAFDRRECTPENVALQIVACTETRTSGWMLFNPENKYVQTAAALQLLEDGFPAKPAPPVAEQASVRP